MVDFERISRAKELELEELKSHIAIDSPEANAQKYRLFVTNTLQTIVLHSEGKVIFVNPAALDLAGAKDESEMLGKSPLFWVHPEDRERVLGRVKKMVITRDPVPWELERFIRLDGRVIDVLVTSAVFEFEGKDVFQVMIQDVTDRINAEKKLKRLNEELKLSNANKDKFFSIIAHDLINPFQTLLGYSETILREYDRLEKDRIKDFIYKIYTASRTSYELLNNLLEWSRVQTNRIQFNPKDFDVKWVATEVINLLEPSSRQKNLIIVNKVVESVMVFADENMISTVLRNLISNAIKFTNYGGKIFVGVNKPSPEVVEIYVRDTGVGIPAEVLDTLFKIEIHNHTRGTAGEKGSGLGLILSKEFIEKNGGTINVVSQIDNGTTFTITLPKSDIK